MTTERLECGRPSKEQKQVWTQKHRFHSNYRGAKNVVGKKQEVILWEKTNFHKNHGTNIQVINNNNEKKN